jgi:hypothetical protein
MARLGRFAAATLVPLVLIGCATMNVSSHIERGADFTHYRTWDWGPADAWPTGDPRLDKNPFFQDYLLGAVEKQMAAKRYVRAEEGTEPDLLIHYHANISQRFDVAGLDTRNGYCYDDCDPRVIEFEQGTLVLDVIDTHTHKVVWRGWAQDSVEGVIDNQARMERQIDTAIRRVFERFPPTL